MRTDSPSTPLGSIPDPDVAATRLTGRLGTVPLVLSVLAFSAPIVTVAGYVAFTILFAGQGAPVAYVAATLLLTLFAVGFTAMTRHVPRPGAFYAYISMGMGRVLGLGGAFLAVLSYTMIMGGLYCFTGVTVSAMIETFGGPATTWWLWTIAAWLVVSTLAYFHVELSAMVLSVVMVLEVIMIVAFDVFTLGQGGAEGLSLDPFSPVTFSHGDVFVGLLFAFMNFIGFEATALYRDEVRNPDRTVPRATYMSVLFIGAFYAISCYALITAYGSRAVEVAETSAGVMFNDAANHFVAWGFSHVALALITTSCVASLLSTHNVVARYIHNLAADRALPAQLAAVHPRHHSPYRASIAAAVAVLVGLVPFVAGGADTGIVIGALAGLGSTGVMVLMALVSVAVIAWFVRTGMPAGETLWKVRIAPVLSAVSITAIVIFAMSRFNLVVGGEPGENLWMLAIPVGVVLAGSLLALYFKAADPDRYAGLGRADRAANGA